MYVVDASVWVSRATSPVSPPSQGGEQVPSPLEKGGPQGGDWVTFSVARRTGSSELAAGAISLMQRLPNARLVPVDAGLAHLGARLAGELRPRGADSLYLALAQRLGFTLVTWDQERLERGRTVALTHTPAQELEP